MKPARPSSSSVSPVAESVRAPSASRVGDPEAGRTVQSVKPDREVIAERARALWRERGCPVGRDEEIWLAAERELSGVGASAGYSRRDAA
jgi:hypothetical protein